MGSALYRSEARGPGGAGALSPSEAWGPAEGEMGVVGWGVGGRGLVFDCEVSCLVSRTVFAYAVNLFC